MGTSQKTGIKNAGAIIERFGGIRPMAKKIDVAVTTVQGWKKRDTIPANRRDQILNAAADHDVNLSDMLDEAAIANQNDRAAPIKNKTAKGSANETAAFVPAHKNAKSPDAPETSAPIQAKKPASTSSKPETTTITKNTWIGAGLLLLALGAIALLLWPQNQDAPQDNQRLSSLENDVKEVKQQQSFFGTLIPDDLETQLLALRDQAEQTQEQLSHVLERAQEKAQQVSNDVLSENAGSLEQRLDKLETHISEFMGSPALTGLLERFNVMESSPDGQLQLDQTMSELSAILGNMGSNMTENETEDPSADNAETATQYTIESALQKARQQSAAMSKTFENVPATDIKAAAMLLGMSQFRSSLGRDNQAFETDLQVLLGLVGDEDLALREALERLAPHAESGVLTPAGLTGEFKTLAGDAVVASLSGEDVTLKDRAKSRFNELFQIEKDGELLTGTNAQATLSKTENLLENGDIEGAIIQAGTLDGEAANILQPLD